MELAEGTKNTFFRFLNEDIAIDELEQWIYSHSGDLEKELQADVYFELISFNFSLKGAASWLKDKILNLVDPNEYYVWSTKKLLHDIIDDKIDLVLATRKLRHLYYATNETFIPITLGIGYESMLDDLPVPTEYDLWNKELLDEKLKEVEWYRERIVNDANLFLKTIL